MTISPLQVVPYDPLWNTLFEKESAQIITKLGKNLSAIHHIGSTAITNLPAKPIIDILIEVNTLDDIPLIEATLATLDYSKFSRQVIPHRSFFSSRYDDQTGYHLHLYEVGDPQVARHVNFRDYLLAYPAQADAYAALKTQLIQQVDNDRYQYTLGKSRFVQQIDVAAKRWAALQGMHHLPQNTGLPAHDWSLQQIIQAMEANLNLHMTYFAQYLEQVEFIRMPGYTLVNSTLPDDTFNYVLDTHLPEKNSHDKIKQVKNYFADTKRPFSWWIGPGDLPLNLTQLLEENHFENTENNTGMFLNLDTWNSDISLPSELKIVRAQDEKTLQDFALVLTNDRTSFETYFSWIANVLTADDPIEYYVGYVKDKPVVRGLSVDYAGVVGLHWLSTAPDERKKGYGTAMQQFRLKHAKEKGYHLAVLQASHEGLSLYKQLGYQACGVFKEFKVEKVF